jgi:predicted  nucleic acid-binding Zn-ribbon protein
LSKFVKLAKDWLDAANSTQNDVAKMKQQLEKAEARAAALEHKLELFMQRVEANEGIDLRPERRVAAQEAMEEGFDGDEELDEPAKRRGRPRKV